MPLPDSGTDDARTNSAIDRKASYGVANRQLATPHSAATDRISSHRTQTAAEQSAERLRAARCDKIAEHAPTKSANDKTCRPVGASAVVAVVTTPIDRVILVQVVNAVLTIPAIMFLGAKIGVVVLIVILPILLTVIVAAVSAFIIGASLAIVVTMCPSSEHLAQLAA